MEAKMTIQEYNDKLKNLEDIYNNDCKLLALKFARENNPYKFGDIIQDSLTKIKIDKVRYTISNKVPICIYEGIKLNKDNSENKLKKRDVIYQTNILKL